MNSDPKNDGEREKDRPDEEKAEHEGIPPLPKKMPEPPDNLKRREDWFRKRSE